MGLFRRRPRFSVSVQIEQLVLEECGGRAVRGDGKEPHEFEQLVLKVSGRRSLSSRNKKIAFRLPVGDRDFRKQQTLPFRERFPFQGKLQRRWRRQKPQLLRFRLYGLPPRAKLAPKKKLLLAEFTVDLTQHLERLFELNAPAEASATSSTAITTPGGPLRAPQPPLSATRPDRSLALRMFASDTSLCVGSHLSVLLDSIHVLKRERSARSGDAAAARRCRRDNQTHRQVELVRTVPLMYRPQTDVGGDSLAFANGVARRVDVDLSSSDSDDSSSGSSDSSGAKPKPRARRRLKRPTGKTVRAPLLLHGAGEGGRVADALIAQVLRTPPTRRPAMAPRVLEVQIDESRRPERLGGGCEDDQEEKEPMPTSSDDVCGAHDHNSDKDTDAAVHPELSLVPDRSDDGEEEEIERVSDAHESPDDHNGEATDDGDNDADDEDDRRSYSFAQGELDHREAVIAALRAENRAQAALIAQLQAENRRLRAEAAIRGSRSSLGASAPSNELSTAPGDAEALERERSASVELDSATDSELVVAKRSASVSFLPSGPTRGAGRRSAGQASAASAPRMLEEHVFEGLVQEIQEEFRYLLPAKAGASISSA